MKCSPEYMSVYCVCALSHAEARKGCCIPWDCSYRQVWAIVWALGMDTRSSGNAAIAFHDWAISPAHITFLIFSTSGERREVSIEESEGIAWLPSPLQQWLASPSRCQQVAWSRSFALLPSSQTAEWGGVRCELLTDTRLHLCPGSLQNLLDCPIFRPWKSMPSSREGRWTGEELKSSHLTLPRRVSMKVERKEALMSGIRAGSSEETSI